MLRNSGQHCRRYWCTETAVRPSASKAAGAHSVRCKGKTAVVCKVSDLCLTATAHSVKLVPDGKGAKCQICLTATAKKCQI
eukprot:671622-Pelagomonas_calceolata.AAC.7